MDMPFQIPEALMPAVIGAGLWYGGCYIFLAPELTERAVELHVAEECLAGSYPDLCPCVLSDIQSGAGVFKNALFVATLSLSDPRVDLFGNHRNPYIEYISLEAQDVNRKQHCETLLTSSDNSAHKPSLANAIKQAEKTAKEEAARKAQLERERLEKQHAQELEEERLANQQILDATAARIEQLEDTVKNNPVTEEAKKKLGQAKRVYTLQDETADELLDWWELALKRAEKLRQDFERNGQ